MKDQRFVLYASAHRPPDVYPRSYVPVFTEAHTARCWLDAMLRGREFTREGDTIFFETDPGYTTSMPIKIRCEQLDAVLAAPRANEELRADYAQHVLRFKFGTWDEVHVRDVPAEDDGESPITKRAAKVERQARAQRPDGYVTITELCAASGILPMIARAALRASDRVKPDFGWAFAPADVPAVKKLCGIA